MRREASAAKIAARVTIWQSVTFSPVTRISKWHSVPQSSGAVRNLDLVALPTAGLSDCLWGTFVTAANVLERPIGPGTNLDPKRWVALAIIAVAQLMVVLDATIVNIALPTAQAALGITDANRPGWSPRTR